MRRLILSALVLLPALASAQTSTSTATASSSHSNTLMARATPPAPFATAGKPASPDAADIMVPVNQTIIDNGDDSDQTNTVYIGSGRTTAPVLAHAVPVSLSLKDIRSEGSTATASIVVHVKVSSQGIPSDLTITHSAGAALDQRALAAISQYRFTPATQSGLPVDSEATVSIAFKSR